MTGPALKQLLKDALNGNELILDAESRALLSHDIASGEAVAEIVVRPTSIASLSNAVALAAKTNFALIPRGSGHSYSGGTVPDRTQSMVIDTTALDQIIEINQKGRFVRVQAGCTWVTLLTALWSLWDTEHRFLALCPVMPALSVAPCLSVRHFSGQQCMAFQTIA